MMAALSPSVLPVSLRAKNEFALFVDRAVFAIDSPSVIVSLSESGSLQSASLKNSAGLRSALSVGWSLEKMKDKGRLSLGSYSWTLGTDIAVFCSYSTNCLPPYSISIVTKPLPLSPYLALQSHSQIVENDLVGRLTNVAEQ